jgi:hypothetical protein
MTSHIYRFRSIKQLIGEFNELEAQQVYFCPPDRLNDPVEGFKDLVWLGDAIVWRSFLKHYLLSMIHVAPLCFGGEPDCGHGHLQNIVFVTPDDLPVGPVRDIYQQAVELFLGEAAVQKFVELMSRRIVGIRRGELTSYLRALHPFALRAVFKEFRERGVPLPEFMTDTAAETARANAMKMMEAVPQLMTAPDASAGAAESFFLATQATADQVNLISLYQMRDRAVTRPMSFFCHAFPSAYVSAIEKLVHRDWYVACFSASPIHAAMWGSYGDGHRGACLKFKTTPNMAGAPALNFRTIAALHGDGRLSWDFRPFEIHKVSYEPAFPPIDFFTSLGSVRVIDLNHFWYRGDGNEFSASKAFKDEDARKKYWNEFRLSALFKTVEWKHEEEYRVILNSGFDFRERLMRRLEYKFEDLTGIIFGARTSLEDKLRILEIIDRKCAKARRSEFEFFEVRYVPSQAVFHLVPLSLLKINYDS